MANKKVGKVIAVAISAIMLLSTLILASQQAKEDVDVLSLPSPSSPRPQETNHKNPMPITANTVPPLFFQLQSPFYGYNNLSNETFEPTIQASTSPPLNSTGDFRIGRWISQAYASAMYLNGTWEFKLYGTLGYIHEAIVETGNQSKNTSGYIQECQSGFNEYENNSNCLIHGYLYAVVKSYHDNSTLFITGYDDEDIANFTISYHQFFWEHNVSDGIMLPAGDRFYVEPWVHVTSFVPRHVDIVFALDTSGSMAGAKMTNLRTATCNFIANLTDADRAGMWTFDGGGNPLQRYNLTYMTAVNRLAFMNTINTTGTGGFTPFYDMLGKAIEDAIQYDTTCTDPVRLEYVVAETDGAANNDYYWSPKAEWLNATTQGGGNNDPGNYLGILKCPPMVYTVGLSLGTDHWNTSLPNNLYPSDGWFAPGYNESYIDTTHPLEYDIWACANSTPCTKANLTAPPWNYGYNTTNWTAPLPPWCQPRPNIGHYYHCDDPTKLGNTFGAIVWSIEQMTGGNYVFTFAYDNEATPSSVSPSIRETPYFKIPVIAGWNLISTPLNLVSSQLPYIILDMDRDTLWDHIQWYNPLDSANHWKQYYSGWSSSLNDLNFANNTMGVWVNIATVGDGFLNLSGLKPTSTSIPLHTGWNMVGYPSLNTTITIAEAFWGTGATMVETFDPNATYRTKVAGPNYVMKPGEGYWVYVPADTLWVVDW